MAAAVPACRWFASPAAQALLSREFEDGTVCFNTHTGETSWLAALTWFLLEALSRAGPAGLEQDDLVAQLLAADDTAATPREATEVVAATLQDLQRAGLVLAGGAS